MLEKWLTGREFPIAHDYSDDEGTAAF